MPWPRALGRAVDMMHGDVRSSLACSTEVMPNEHRGWSRPIRLRGIVAVIPGATA